MSFVHSTSTTPFSTNMGPYRADPGASAPLSDFLKHQQDKEAEVAMHRASEHYKFLGLVIGLPVT